jgi:hypothetical protein
MKLLISYILPPVFTKFIRFILLKSYLPFMKFNDADLHENENSQGYKSIYYEVQASNRIKPFFVNVEKLYYFGGIKYTSDKHPFMSYYRNGKGALRNFYDNHIPNCIMEKHFLSPKTIYPLKGVDLPWYEVREKKYIYGEKGLNYKHGGQHFGPASDKKIKLEVERLNSLKNSIISHGYRKFFDGFPRGYVLERENNYSIIIVGGQHRVATLIHLGYKKLPIMFSKSYPPIVNINDVDNWPYVKAGIIKKNDAIDIFNSYFM